MVSLEDSKENFILDNIEDYSVTSLQEERKRTGRYLAAGIVLFLVALGLYHALLYGSPKLSALLGAAFVMFLYLVWILYASQRKKKIMKLNEEKLQRDLEEVIIPQIIETKQEVKRKDRRHHHHHHKHHYHHNFNFEEEEVEKNPDRPMFIRSYSIA